MFPFDGSFTGMVLWTVLVLVFGFFLGGCANECRQTKRDPVVAYPPAPKDERSLLQMDMDRAMAHANQLMSEDRDAR